MEFTKEQKELFQKALTEYRNSDFLSFADWADSLLKPETKFIDVRIEYDYDSSNSSLPLTANSLETHFDIATELKNTKVTELHGDNFIDFGHYVLDHPEYLVENAYKNWRSERSNK